MARFALRVKSKSGQQVVETLTPQSTILDLKNQLSSLTGIPVNRLHVLNGFPPKIFDLSRNDETLNASGISTGDTLIVEEKNSEESSTSSKHDDVHARTHISNKDLDCPGILMKRVVPADNSCLFTSIGFVLSGKVDTSIAPNMRQIIAEVVSKDSEQYSEAILGKDSYRDIRWTHK